ncbi:Uncharacterized hydrolase YxeP [Mycoplasmopsis bovigenitalium]|uniref:Uncharacterized hydrolase YxeP n=1 Tax=Mycoplasmopsis bovigenitalium TaxID=2112 RepID=A0A449A9H9_9BACT|nr:M20 family metallopeptidase [Mycoplasmopsis bovigenitalium]VEU60840.1 Uncharacterized hydrolase YxeP [Mycoplasmopsis bovigenitalium]
MSYLTRAKELFEEAKQIRRQIHANPEVGFELPNTAKLIEKILDKYNIKHQRLDDTYAIIGTLGDAKKGKTLLLRADMDALPTTEESGLDFASKNGAAHLCGHDLHTTCLLISLIILKENENKLKGQIKFLFQPAEETLNGGALMLKKGILNNPKPDAGLALHMWPNGEKLGILVQRKEALASALNFKIEIEGKGAHGAMPFNGVDPVFVASQIINATNGILARELPSNKGASLSMGFIEAPGGAINVVPSRAYLQGTARSLFAETTEHLRTRLPEVTEYIAKAFRANAKFEFVANVPALVNNENMADLVIESSQQSLNNEYNVDYYEPALASEDYAHIADELPESCYFLVSCPAFEDKSKNIGVHNPKTIFNEQALIIGPTAMVQSAINWLDKNSK